MSNHAPRTSKKEQEASAKFQEAINIYMQHPLPDGALERTKEYAKRIEEQLADKHWTKSYFAKVIGVSKQTITDMINAPSSAINLQRLYVVSAAFGCTPSYMLGLVEKNSEHYDKDTNQKNTWDPLIPIDAQMKRFQDILHEAAHTDPFFVDFICQIVENKQIDRAKRIIEATDLAKPRDIPLGFLPDSWLTESGFYCEVQRLKKVLLQKDTELCRQKLAIECLQKELVEIDGLAMHLRRIAESL